MAADAPRRGARSGVRWLALAAAVVVGGIAIAEVATSGSGGDGGRRAPPLPEKVLVGPPVTLASLEGRVAIINFWASWCRPCKREAAAYQQLSTRLGPRIRLVGVNWGDGASGARSFIARYHWTFPNLRDSTNESGSRFGLTGLPTTYVLDRHGTIARTLRGPQTAEQVERAARSVAAE